MNPATPPGRRKLVLAVLVSVVLHSPIGLYWWISGGETPSYGPGFGTAVAGPSDRETTIVLRDPPTIRTEKSATPARPVPPGPLPPSIGETRPAPASAGAVHQVSDSRPQTGSLPKNAGGRPLHGRLKSGKSIVYVLDRSSSMGASGVYPAATGAIKVSLAELGPDVRFQVVAYNGRGEACGSSLLAATPKNVEHVSKWLDQRWAEGLSDHVAGVREGMYLRPDAVVLLTDADDFDERQVKAIAALVRSRAHLSVVIFGDRRGNNGTPLARLVHEMGGTVQYFGR